MRLKLKQQPWLLISALTVGSILLLLQFLPILHLNDFKNILSNSDLPQSHHNQYSSTQTSNHQRQAHIETGKPLKECIPEKYRELFSNLPEEALSNWHKPRLHLQIITFNRPQSLNRLLDSLLNAEMMCDELSITFHVEANADADSLQLINSFFWPFGPKTVHRRIIVGGLMSAIVESWYPGSRDDYTIILEDDIEVSSLFYIWAKLTLLRYRYAGSTNPRLFGVSLYTPRLQVHNMSVSYLIILHVLHRK